MSNEIVATTEEAAEVLAAIADQNYNKDGNVFEFVYSLPEVSCKDFLCNFG